MKKLIAMALALTMSLTLVSCGKKENNDGGSSGEQEKNSTETVTYRCSTNHAENFNVSVALRYWADLVRERTDGRINIEIYYDAVLGDEKSAIEQCQYGGLDFARVNISPMCEFVDGFNGLSMPYLYNDDEHFWKAMETVGMDLLTSKEMQDAGFYGLTWYDGGTRNFYNSKKPIHTPADMAGMDIRVQESSLMMDMIKALGANPTAMPYGDVYSGLQTGVIDGAENSVVQYLEVSHYEHAPYITLDGHTRAPDMLFMSEKVRQTMSEEDVKIIADAARESWEMQRKLWAEVDAEARGKLEDAGVEFVDLTPEEFQSFVDACEPMWENYQDGKYMDIIKEIRELA